MKKILSIAAAAILCLGVLAGCGDTATNGGVDSSDVSTSTSKVASKEDLAGARVGVQEGTTGDLYVSDEEEVPGAQVSRYKKAVDAAVDLKNDRLDAIVLDELPAQKIVDKNDDLTILKEEFTKEDYAIAVKKGNTELLEQVNACLQQMKEDGRFDTIAAAFIEGDEVALEELAALPAPEGDTVLRMATNAEFEPFEFRDEQNEITGFDIEVAKAIARDLGMGFEVTDMNFDSLINALSSDMADIVIAGMTVTEERQQNVDFTDSYYTSTQVIIVKK